MIRKPTRSMKIGHSNGSSLEKFTDVMKLVKNSPRTIQDIVDITGYARVTVARYLTLLEAEEFVVRDGVGGKLGGAQAYKWVDWT